MLEDALSYPTTGESGLARILIGGVLGLLSLLVLPAFVLSGYMIRAMASSSRDEAEPPAFEDWGGLFVDGLKATVVAVAYGLAPIVVMLLTAGVLGAGVNAGGDAGGALASLGVIGILVVVTLLFVMQYALPAALTNLAREGRLGGAFDFGTLKPVLTSGAYVKAVLLVFGIALVGGTVFSVFALVTLGVGYLAAPFFYFWLYLAGSYMFGTAFGDVVDPAAGGANRQVRTA